MKFLYGLLVFVPIAIVTRIAGAPPIAVFVVSALAIIPLSGILGAATETVAEHTSPAVGGVLSATMGNLAELIIAAVALRAGLIDLVKASITGSVLSNLLLVLGFAPNPTRSSAALARRCCSSLYSASWYRRCFRGCIPTPKGWRLFGCPTTSPDC